MTCYTLSSYSEHNRKRKQQIVGYLFSFGKSLYIDKESPITTYTVDQTPVELKFLIILIIKYIIQTCV